MQKGSAGKISAIGLLVDAPKSDFGSTNDGNTARVFWQLVIASLITEIDEILVRKLHMVLTTIRKRRYKSGKGLKIFSRTSLS
ncbi:hypothetical protein TNCT_729641 [Trichonephila clavata]|uniref:Uncharacterized protein n=1 Tax=Trichonephila clavata TaxID=2740835 RepID=A0A8X6IT15_TRICU|nr:hypothetical protein TNCT_729641 [Trichonephila clavata]